MGDDLHLDWQSVEAGDGVLAVPIVGARDDALDLALRRAIEQPVVYSTWGSMHVDGEHVVVFLRDGAVDHDNLRVTLDNLVKGAVAAAPRERSHLEAESAAAAERAARQSEVARDAADALRTRPPADRG